MYASMLSTSLVMHHNLQVEELDLSISTDYPFVGASTEGLVPCDCFSNGISEIKLHSF